MAAASYQRTSYLPGEVAQVDWWHTGLWVPVGKGRTRQAFGLVSTLPASAALRGVFTLAYTTTSFCAALVGYLETSILPLRSAAGLADLQAQADAWTLEVADQRQVRRLGARLPMRWRSSGQPCGPLPDRWPDTNRQLEVRASRDGFVRVAGVDYSVLPRLAGRRLGVRLSPTRVVVGCEGAQVARHPRSWVPADVVLAPDHARQLRLAREAAGRRHAKDVQVQVADLARYDQLAGVGS